MFKKMTYFVAIIFAITLFDVACVKAQSRLQSISKGVEDNDRGKVVSDEAGNKDGKPAGLNDVIFFGVFENYLPTKRYNARLTVFAEPRKFLLGHRACTKIIKIRDRINQYFFETKFDIDRKGRINTEGLDNGVREAIKKGLKTKLEYFTSIYVFSGRYNTVKVPKALKGQTLTDCAGVISKKAELDKANKGK